MIPVLISVHRTGDFERSFHLYYEGGGTLWDIAFEIRGVASERQSLAKGTTR